jgi:quinone-modifying oxidoreductase subunit QmoC
MLMAQWGRRDELMADPDLWMCHQCGDCTTYCPRGARPGDVLAAIRSYTYRYYAFPSFMGKALASPAALPLLVLAPIALLLTLMFAFAPVGPDGQFQFLTSSVTDFNLFLPHSSVDALFVLGNIIVFLFAAIGFVRFWKALGRGSDRKISFVSGLIGTIREFIPHTLFKDCDQNRPRATAHMILFFGFVGAMITTGAIFVFVFIPHYLHLLGLESISSWFDVPINLPHPVKFIGGLSGLALVVGSAMLLFRRWSDREGVGANGYSDYFFLYVIFATGLTGMLAWLIRAADGGLTAYVVYFIHMVFVFMLLWYMPYSKFAHMIYRTMALTHAKMIGRRPAAG